jgi:exonuclease V gamma subunit
MPETIQEREDALLTLEDHIYELSKLFRESYLSTGRGALIVYTDILESGHRPSSIDYNRKEESLELFNAKNSKAQLAKMIDGYDPSSEGILVLVTKSNATWFVTVKLRSRRQVGL